MAPHGNTVLHLVLWQQVGEDQFGNFYYQGKDGRRWVQYNGYAEASTIPPGWHGWMHYRTDRTPADSDYQPHEWEREHQPNSTGSEAAYRPKNPINANGTSKRPQADNDYKSWSP